MKSTGILVFYNTWSVLYCDEGIRAYYANLLERKLWIKIMPPKWGAHVSVIRGEPVEDQYKKNWKKYDGKRVEFEYSNIIKEGTGGNGYYYYWLPITCDFLLDVRSQFGLARESITLHMTLGCLTE